MRPCTLPGTSPGGPCPSEPTATASTGFARSMSTAMAAQPPSTFPRTTSTSAAALATAQSTSACRPSNSTATCGGAAQASKTRPHSCGRITSTGSFSSSAARACPFRRARRCRARTTRSSWTQSPISVRPCSRDFTLLESGRDPTLRQFRAQLPPQPRPRPRLPLRQRPRRRPCPRLRPRLRPQLRPQLRQRLRLRHR